MYRQESEIGRLQKEVNLVSIQFQDLQEETDEYRLKIENLQNVISNQQIEISAKIEKRIKAEAYKELAEKLEEKIGDCHIVSDGEYCGFDCGYIHGCIDNLLKEMVGE